MCATLTALNNSHNTMIELNTIPRPAKFFGLAGLLPFFAGSIVCWLDVSWLPQRFNGPLIITAYSAVILSFLGGIRWGVAMQHGLLMHSFSVVGWAMVPSLIAWAALLLPAKTALAMIIIGLTIQLFIDYQSSRADLTPAWFMSLRLILTLGALLSILMAWFAL